jgi:hypothetical protein
VAKNATIEGDITSQNADISGKVTATSGKVGGYDISGDSLVGNDVTLGRNSIIIDDVELKSQFFSGLGTSLSLEGKVVNIGYINPGTEIVALYLGGKPLALGGGTNNSQSIGHETSSFKTRFQGSAVSSGFGDLELGSFGGVVRILGDVVPAIHNHYNIGQSSMRYNNIYLTNQPNVSSDIRQKSLIQNIPSDLINYLKEIKPKMYRQNDKWHFGYIAQDVERAIYKYALNKVGFKDAWDLVKEFAFLAKDESYMSLLYGEIAVLKEKEMQNRIDELEDRIFKLEKIINGK